MNRYINIDRVFSAIILFAVILFAICIGMEHISRSEVECVSNINSHGSLTVYEKDSVVYAYQGEINIVNDGTDGNDIEILIDIDENMKP